MVGLIINNKDILLISQLTADAAYHLDRCFSEGTGFFSGNDIFSKPACAVSFSEFKGMKIGDNDLGLSQLIE